MASATLKSLTVGYKAGERVVAAGEAGGCMFVVHSGTVRLLRRPEGGGDGEPVEVAVLEKGDFFGESAILDGKPYPMDAVAASDCEIVEISASTLQKMLDANPEVAVRMLRKLSQRLERIESRLSRTRAEPEDAGPAAPAPAPAVRSRARATGPRLESEDGSVRFELTGSEVLIGRYDPVTEIQPEIDLSELDVKRSVSRRHARMTRRKGRWYVTEEVGALNGTYVNGVRLLPGRGAPIADGDTLSFGMVRVVYRES
ncbi:MAG: FHA domain-containing protein [Acidobacteria bacterium]|nr:MAG: FHA domain-containing protein [Acidobacteriota bacterium]